MPKLVNRSPAFPGLRTALPAPKANLKAPKVKLLGVPIDFPKSKKQKQLPISRIHTFVKNYPVQVFAGTTRRTL